MKVIYKYSVENDFITLPDGYQIIKIDWSIADDEAFLWAIVDPSETKTVTLHLYTVYTGQQIPIGANIYLGTYEDSTGCIHHVFKS